MSAFWDCNEASLLTVESHQMDTVGESKLDIAAPNIDPSVPVPLLTGSSVGAAGESSSVRDVSYDSEITTLFATSDSGLLMQVLCDSLTAVVFPNATGKCTSRIRFRHVQRMID